MNKARIFISYPHRGNGPQWKEALLRPLQVLEHHSLVDAWSDEGIEIGDPWDQKIREATDGALVAVLVLTKEALKSHYIRTVEFPVLEGRQQRDKLLVIPVVCEECDWKAHAWLQSTQAPNGSKPLLELSIAGRDRIFRELAAKIASELSRISLAGLPASTELIGAGVDEGVRIYPENFPLNRAAGQREERLIGREQELALIDLAFSQTYTSVVSLVGWGGVGKSMLVRRWAERLRRAGWFGMRRVYAWSFYSQGTREDRQASEEPFLAHALEWFGVHCEPTLSPREKGRLLAEAVAAQETLLVLDGIEPLQVAAGPMGGELRAPGVQNLLKQLARMTGGTRRGLCLVTTRVPLTDLNDFQRRPGDAWGSVLRVELGNLTDEAGAHLLHHVGANRAGRATIRSDDAELLLASNEVGGHALTLNLLGRFLGRAHYGDIRRRDHVNFEEADRTVQGGTTFRMLAAFEKWFANSADIERRSLAVLRLLGLFDRPADEGCIAALREGPAIAGITDLFFVGPDGASDWATKKPLPDESFNAAISFLADFGLLVVEVAGERMLDCHPLIREYFDRRISVADPGAWQSAHQRLYEHLKGSVTYRPGTILGLQPLYQSVGHGCRAGKHSEALALIRDRIQRESEYFSTYKLGATASDLQAFASFFRQFPDPATLPADCPARDKAFILRQVGYSLRARGSLDDAERAYTHAVALADQGAQPDWDQAATAAQLLGEVLLLHGNVNAACNKMQLAVRNAADHLRDGYRLRINLTYLGNALMQAGNRGEARRAFLKAEAVTQSREGQPQPLTLGNLFRFGEWLLNEGEADKALAMLKVAAPLEEIDPHKSLFSDGLRQLLLGMIVVQSASLSDHVVSDANHHFSSAHDNFTKASREDFRARTLIEWASCRDGSWQAAEAVRRLDEAREIAERGPMGLHLADIFLRRAPLFRAQKPYPWNSSAQDDLAAAAKLIGDYGYHRGDAELAAAG